ncbi:MAG: hypothetical protein V2J14_06865 [Erythrobacter sp.]|jgi:hypothetical protein|nr:hypothetical protein [Erythrobacter sp.]
MSDDIRRDSALGEMLDRYRVPDLPDGFADRVIAATAARPSPLPITRPVRPRWRSARRLAIGTVAFGALAGAAAAAGLLRDLPVSLPSPGQVWEAITGTPAEPAAPAPAALPSATPAPARSLDELLAAPIRTIDELEETYRRIDELREERSASRREQVDARIDEALERRRALGMPAPSIEQERRLKERLGRLRERRDEVVEQGTRERRDQQRERIEQGEALTGEDLLEDAIEDARSKAPPALRDRIERFRQLSPEDRQERLRRLRERREERLERGAHLPQRPAAPTATPSETATPEPSETPDVERPSSVPATRDSA